LTGIVPVVQWGRH